MRSSTATTKFTGTLTNREAIGKREAGVMAFAHWVLQNTAGKFLFVDLQGMKCTITERDGDGILMLFDLMSHSYTQTSCAGDHGPKGIYAFLGSHICTTVCKAMKLISLPELCTILQRNIDDHAYEDQIAQEHGLAVDEYPGDREQLQREGFLQPPTIETT
ncbi:hypothetical protein JB92DRAFT_2817488 [Gautieria morchelliformis]|nr:hypothetical protein JB92DRAFT_2817488 [Gautieria morchelliformis]